MISQKKVAVLTAVMIVPLVLIALSMTLALAQQPVFIQKSDSPDPVYAGEELFYEIFITPPEMGLWWITDTLPPEVTYITDTLAHIPVPGGTYVISEGCQLVGNELGCLLYASEWEPRSFQIKTRVAPDAVAGLDTGTVVANNVAWLTDWDGSPGYPGPFAAEGTFIEDLADLLVVKMSKPDTHVEAGELFTYTIFVENLGPSYARNVSIRDEILSSGAFSVMEVLGDPNREDACYVAPGGGIPEGPGETIECDLADPLEPKDIGGRGRWVIQVVLSANETQDVNNLVNVFSGDPDGPEGPGMPTADPDLSNNLADDFIYVTDAADLQIGKSLDYCSGDGFDGRCVAGGMAVFHLAVFNGGPSTAENVVVEDLLPAGVTVVGVRGPGSCTTGIPGDPLAPLTCNLGDLPPDIWRDIYIEVQIDPDYVDAELPFDYRELENDAWVYSDIFDPNNGNNRDHVIIEVYTYSELAITKWGFPDVVVPGEEMEYEIRVRNAGPSTVDMLHFVDLLPDGVTFLDYWIEQGTGSCTYHDSLPWPWWEDYRGVHCYLDEIPPNGINMVHLQVLVNSDVDWDAGFYDVCNIIPDDDNRFDNDAEEWMPDDPFFMPGWFADSYIEIPWELSYIENEDEYFGWCPRGFDPQADLSIEKTSEPPKIYPGEQKVYHITVANNGPADAPGVMVTDTLPIELQYQIDTDNCDLVSAGPPEVLECDLGTIPAGESLQFDIHALVAPDYAVTQTVEITNTAQVSMTTDLVLDPDLANNTDTTTNLILPPDVADLGLTKGTVTPPPGPPYYAGNNARFQLDVTNYGPGAAENVVLEDMLPLGVSVLGVTPSQGSCTTGTPGSTPIVCGLGRLDRDATATVFVRVAIDPDYEGSLENDAVVYSDIFDPNNGNDRASVIVQVQTRADLDIDKDAPPPFPWRAGEIRTYRYNINNWGPSVSRDVRLRDFLPDEVEFVSAYAFKEGSEGGIPLPCHASAANVLICPLGDIPPTDPPGPVVVLVDVYIKPDVLDGTTICNSADLITETPDRRPARDSICLRVSNEADLSVWKEADPWKVYAGEQVRYDIEVTNNGPGTAYDVFVTDTLPISVTYELDTDDCDLVLSDPQDVLSCTLGTIPPGETRNFSIFARVDPGADPGTVSNRADVYSETTYDPIDYNDWNTAPTLIQGKADLKITKFGKPDGEVRADEELIYTVIVDNLGTGYAHDVTLRDVLASNGEFDLLSVTSDRDADCDPTSGPFTNTLQLTCALTGTLDVMTSEPGSGRWIVTVVVEAAEPQSINNVAHVVLSDYDPDLSNNQAIAEHDITAVADLELSKSAWGEMPTGCEGAFELLENEVAAGATVTYTLTVTNTGPSTAENVVVRDQPLPSLLDIAVQSITPSQGNCLTANIGPTDYLLTCNLGTLGPDMTATVEFTATVPPWVLDGTILVNDALAYSDMFDDDTGNSIVTNHTAVTTWADLEVVKSQEPEVALPTQQITYTITVTNLGPSDVYGAIVSDTVPVTMTNVTVECCASDEGDCDVPCEPTCPEEPCPPPEVDLWAGLDLPVGESAVYTLMGTLDFWPCGPFTNTVTVDAPNGVVDPDRDIDPCPDNNLSEAVNDPICHYEPLVLKEYPGPDSIP